MAHSYQEPQKHFSQKLGNGFTNSWCKSILEALDLGLQDR